MTTMTRAPKPKRGARALRSLGVRGHYIALVIVIGALFFTPLVAPTTAMPVLIRTLIIAIMAIGWNIMSGYGGMFSFGHAAFFGIGAYTDAVLLTKFGISPWLSMILGGALAAGAGVLIAYLCLKYRLAGSYFALATFAFAQMFLLVSTNLKLVNGTEGINIPILPNESWKMLQFDPGSSWYFWIPLLLAGIAIAITIAFMSSRSGQFTQAIRDDAVAAESLGINLMRYRLVPVAISCAITAVAGVFYVQYYLFIGPDQAFGLTVTTNSIVPAVIGGMSTFWGPLIGAALIGPLSAVIANLVRTPPPFLGFVKGLSGLDVATYAVLLIAIVIFLPKGIYGTIRERVRR
jgi:branched-chain amino acid transport system permease protein